MKTFLVTGNFDGEIQDFFFFWRGLEHAEKGREGDRTN